MDIITPLENALSALICYNVFITPQPSGQLEIIPPSGHIILPSGCMIPPSGRLDLRSTAALRRDHAPLGRNNVTLWRYNFHCPSGWGVIISHYDIEGPKFDVMSQKPPTKLALAQGRRALSFISHRTKKIAP